MAFRILLLVGLCAATADADIYRWDTGEVIPGTEGLELIPGAELSQLDLAYAELVAVGASRADLTGANLEMTNLSHARGVATFSNANLTQANLANTEFIKTVFTNAKLIGANLTGATLGWPILSGADFTDATIREAILSDQFTREQLYSTASYRSKDLFGIDIGFIDLSNSDLRGQDLRHASLYSASLTNANLVGADLRNTNLEVDDLNSVRFDSTTKYNQWTQFPAGFDPLAAGLNFVASLPGDFDSNDQFDAADLALFPVLQSTYPAEGWPWRMQDLNRDLQLDHLDLAFWVHDIKGTWFGDADLDGEFTSGDLVSVLAAGKYEDDFTANSGWADGDWNTDGEFTSADLVVALQDGGYEQGPRVPPAAVPEPSTLPSVLVGLIAAAFVSRSRRQTV